MSRSAASGIWLVAVVCLCIILPTFAVQGQSNPVYVDDSPLAREMFARAIDHSEDNIGEAVRLFQELLDDYPDRLIATGDSPGSTYVTVRTRVLRALRNEEHLLERYRQAEDAHARRLLNAGRYQQLARSRPLTTSGLEAMLRLAQGNLERGHFVAAVRWLDEAIEHPDLSEQAAAGPDNERRAAHAWHMIGLAAAHQNREARVAEALEQLDTLGRRAERLRDHLAEYREHAAGWRLRTGKTPLDITLAAGIDDLVAEEIWSYPLEDSIFERRDRNTAPDRPIMGRSLRQSVEDGHFLTVAPTVKDGVVYINQGHRISAIDALSGSSVWSRDFVDRPAVSVIDREDQQPRDLNVVVVRDDALVTLTGHAYATDRSSDGRLIRLDAATGELVWAAGLSGLRGADGELEDLFPHSVPVIVDDRVILLTRRVSRQSLSSTYLVSFDLQTGEPDWVRHIVSSSSTRRAGRAFSTIAVADGDVYIASPVGAVARVDAATGHVRWLHRFPVGITPPPWEQAQRGWELLTPIVLEDRIIAVEPGYRRVAVLDRRNGMVMRSIDTHAQGDSGGFQTPAYLLAGNRCLIVVGNHISAYDPEDLDHPVWRIPTSRDDRAQSPMNGGHVTPIGHDLWVEPFKPYGRIQVARDIHSPAGDGTMRGQGSSWLIVPTQQGVRVVDEESGRITADLAVRKPGNVLASDAQLLVAGNNELNAYMSLSEAEALMRQRIARAPGDPAGAMGLIRLGLRLHAPGLQSRDGVKSRGFEMLMEGADLALQSIDAMLESDRSREVRAAERHREELVDLLLNTVILRHGEETKQVAAEVAKERGDSPWRDHQRLVLDREEAEQYFALIDRLVTSPEQQVAALMKRGDWYAAGERGEDVGRAIETWQQILANRELGQVHWRERSSAQRVDVRTPTTVIRPAGLSALGRIARLIDAHGVSSYSAQAAYARMRVDTLIERGEPARLMEFVRQFPLSDAASDAAVAASEMYLSSDAAQGRPWPDGAGDGQRASGVDRALGALMEAYWLSGATGEGAVSRVAGAGAGDGAGALPVVLRRYIEIALEHDRRSAALEGLRYAGLRYGEGVSITGGVLAWSRRLLPGVSPLHVGGEYGRPSVGVAGGEARVWEGRLVPLSSRLQSAGDRGMLPLLPRDSVLLLVDGADDEGGGLALAKFSANAQGSQSPGFVERWRTPLDGRSPRIVLWSDEQILIEYEDGGGVWRVKSLSPVDGAVLWQTAGAGQRGGGGGGAEHWALGGESGGVTLVSRDHLVLVWPNGKVEGYELGLEGRSHRQPSWSWQGEANPLIDATLSGGTVMVLGGTRPTLAVLDVRTGRERVEPYRPPFAGQRIAWMEALPMGMLVYGSDAGLTKVHGLRGELVWSNQSHMAKESARGWQVGLEIVIEDRGGNLRRLDRLSGELGDSYEVPMHGDWEPLRLVTVQVDGESLIARYRQRFVRYDIDGNVIGADMILDERADEWLLRADDRFVMISNISDPRNGRFALGEEPQATYRVYLLSPNGRLLGEGIDLKLPPMLERIDTARLCDGWLLLSADDWTIAVPLPRL